MERFFKYYKIAHKISKLDKDEKEAISFYLDVVVYGITNAFESCNYNRFILKIAELNHSLLSSSTNKDIFFIEYAPLFQKQNEKLFKKKFSKSNYKYYVRNICKVFSTYPNLEAFLRDEYFDVE